MENNTPNQVPSTPEPQEEQPSFLKKYKRLIIFSGIFLFVFISFILINNETQVYSGNVSIEKIGEINSESTIYSNGLLRTYSLRDGFRYYFMDEDGIDLIKEFDSFSLGRWFPVDDSYVDYLYGFDEKTKEFLIYKVKDKKLLPVVRNIDEYYGADIYDFWSSYDRSLDIEKLDFFTRDVNPEPFRVRFFKDSSGAKYAVLKHAKKYSYDLYFFDGGNLYYMLSAPFINIFQEGDIFMAEILNLNTSQEEIYRLEGNSIILSSKEEIMEVKTERGIFYDSIKNNWRVKGDENYSTNFYAKSASEGYVAIADTGEPVWNCSLYYVKDGNFSKIMSGSWVKTGCGDFHSAPDNNVLYVQETTSLEESDTKAYMLQGLQAYFIKELKNINLYGLAYNNKEKAYYTNSPIYGASELSPEKVAIYRIVLE